MIIEASFVPPDVAEALKRAGYDEECMGCYDVDQWPNTPVKLLIDYSNLPNPPELYNEIIQRHLRERPGMFKSRRRNSQLAQWQIAAPLFDDVVEWFSEKYNMDILPVRSSDIKSWYFVISDDSSRQPNWQFDPSITYFPTRRIALAAGIMKAIKLIKV